jgi:iron(III) transport system ATP-binding protein
VSAGYLRLEGLSKRFGQTAVLRDLDLDARRGEVLALLGPSGSGKTTALRLIAGFDAPDSGRVWLDGTDVTRVRPERRGCGMVFQSYALFPHLTVGQNVAFGLHGEAAAKDARVAEVLRLVHLAGFQSRRIGELSGGMQQRVALARALAPRPRVLLLDEPLSNLDPSLRDRTRRELRSAIDEVGITTVLVTHEQEEAFELADRVAVLHSGRLDQVGTPEELFDRPATPFVAAFVGRGVALPARATGPDEAALALGEGPTWPVVFVAPVESGAELEVFARAAALDLAPPGRPGALPGQVVARRFGRPLATFRVAVAVGEIEVLAPPGAAAAGDAVGVIVRPGSALPAFRKKGDRL